MRKPRLVSSVCAKCGISFTREHHGIPNPDRIICSRYCTGTHPVPLGPSTPIVFLTCEHCGALFARARKEVSHDATHTYCSDECHSLGRRLPRPDAATLAALRKIHSNDTLGTMYGVTGRRIRVWANEYALPHKRRTPGTATPTDNQFATKRQNQKRYAAVKRSAVNTLTRKQWEEIKVAYGYRCAYCGRKLKSKDLTKDHILPVCKGGAHAKSNIVPACRSCNARKGKGEVLKPVQLLLL
jgi:5-methylcytosine-specific restriction endonuclease McrA